jgi:DNA repair protein RadC
MKTKSVFLRIGCVAENVSTDAARSSREIFDLLKERANADRENLYLILFNAKWGIIGIELHSIGTINMAMVYTREILKSVILKNSTFAAIVHNHPSGDPEPSIEDRAMTVQVARALRLIDSRLVDHVIIGAMKFGVNNFYSFADHGDGELKGEI